MSNSFFEDMREAPADAIFKLQAAFEKDPRPNKVNLSIGVYRDENLNTPVLSCVKKAEKYLLSTETTKEYLPISGDSLFIQECQKLIFGDVSKTICGIQTPGGTGALCVGGQFLVREVSDQIYIPTPTWPNHTGVFENCGFRIHNYNYYKEQRVDQDAILQTLKNAPKRSIVLFHACCHNPTGADIKDWDLIAEIIKERDLLPFFDFAYQGFGEGVQEDARAIRLFSQKGIEFLVASSYSKNFGLYSERVGALFVVTNNEIAAKNVLSTLKIYARTTYSNPPKHGSSVVGHILSDPSLKDEWLQEVNSMRHRIQSLRNQFVEKIKKRNYSYLLDRLGMFCYLDLKETLVTQLKEEYGIYMAGGGRINIAGLSQHNIRYVTETLNKIL